MLGLPEILAARRLIAGRLPRTPLLEHPGLSDQLGAEVWVKHENHQPTGSFKVRGGLHLALSLPEADRERGLFTASTGNHAQSIAYGGRAAGIPVTVAVPEGANPAKVAGTRALGAEVVIHGRDFDEAREWIGGVAEERGGRFIGPTDPELIAGVGTYALEIVEDLPDVETVLVPVGAGSGACGCCLAVKTVNPEARVIGVQSEAAPTQERTWRAGSPQSAAMQSRAEGVATRVPFPNTHVILGDPQRGLDDFLLVSDDAMEAAIVLYLAEARTVAEHAGAAPLAAALAHRERFAGQKIVLVLSGGNLTLPALREILGNHPGPA